MTKIISTIMTLGLVVAALVMNQGCGSSTEKAPISTLHDATYIGAGSYWEWDLNTDGSFTATKRDSRTGPVVMTINGTYVTNSTGFYTFTVGSATGTDPGLPASGVTAHGFGVPGVVLMVKAEGGSDDDLLVMPALSGTCPSGTVDFNWVQASPGSDSGNLYTKDIWGNASLTLAAGSLTGSKFKFNDDNEFGVTLTTHNGCSAGEYVFSGGKINMTSSGVGLVKSDGTDSGSDILALPRETTVTLDTVRNKEYLGLVFSRNGGNGDIKPLNVSIGAANGTYSLLSDVATGATSETGTITLIEAGTGQRAGFVKMTASGSSSERTPTMWTAVVSNINGSNRTLMFASGGNVKNTDPTDVVDAFALVLIQK